jgi:hypothetical protein
MSLAYFDTAMGFAAVMLMLSMLVTILVQMVETALNLRGKNLLWGVQRLIEKVIPAYVEHARTIADKVLTNNALSHTLGRYAVAIRPEELLLVLKEFSESAPKDDDQLGKRLKAAATDVINKANAAGSDVKGWFNTIMDRTTERFVIHTRLVTALFAFGLAFALHIDTPYIVAQLSSKPEVRTAVVNAALKDAVPHYEEMQKTDPLPVEAMRALARSNPAEAAKLEGAAGLKTRAEGRNWIETKVPDAATQKKLLGDYEAQFDELGKKRIQDLHADYDKVRGWVEASQLELGPDTARYCDPKRTDSVWSILGCGPTGITPKHVLGMLVTALFLSLGAPFWFNLLRNMSNLRPILAGKVEKDQAGPPS